MNNVSEPALTYPTACYELNGMVIVPHYKEDVFVLPGRKQTVTEAQLVAAGATRRIEALWERPQHKAIE